MVLALLLSYPSEMGGGGYITNSCPWWLLPAEGASRQAYPETHGKQIICLSWYHYTFRYFFFRHYLNSPFFLIHHFSLVLCVGIVLCRVPILKKNVYEIFAIQIIGIIICFSVHWLPTSTNTVLCGVINRWESMYVGMYNMYICDLLNFVVFWNMRVKRGMHEFWSQFCWHHLHKTLKYMHRNIWTPPVEGGKIVLLTC